MAHGNTIGMGDPSIFGVFGFLTKYQIFILYLEPRLVPGLWEKNTEKKMIPNYNTVNHEAWALIVTELERTHTKNRKKKMPSTILVTAGSRLW